MHIFIKLDWRFLFIHQLPQSDMFIQQSARTVHLRKFASAQKYIMIKRSWNNYENINVSLTLDTMPSKWNGITSIYHVTIHCFLFFFFSVGPSCLLSLVQKIWGRWLLFLFLRPEPSRLMQQTVWWPCRPCLTLKFISTMMPSEIYNIAE